MFMYFHIRPQLRSLLLLQAIRSILMLLASVQWQKKKAKSSQTNTVPNSLNAQPSPTSTSETSSSSSFSSSTQQTPDVQRRSPHVLSCNYHFIRVLFTVILYQYYFITSSITSFESLTVSFSLFNFCEDSLFYNSNILVMIFASIHVLLEICIAENSYSFYWFIR